MRCNQKLLVVSGGFTAGEADFEENEGEEFSFDEHLLERISILEEATKRLGESVGRILKAIGKLERTGLISQTGLATLRELLERKRVLSHEEWSDLWESKVNYQLLALEKLERFVGLKGRIAVLHQGDRHELFLKHLDAAEAALYAFDIDAALESLHAAYKIDRDNYELAYFIGETYFNEGQTDQALDFFARVLEARPDHSDALVYSGVVHHEAGDAALAEVCLRKAVERCPESFLAHFSLGAVLASGNDPEGAIPLLAKAVEIHAAPHALYLLGSCLHEVRKLGPAIRTLSQAVRLDPGFEDAYHVLGLAYLDRQWHRKALEAFRQAQRLNPNKMMYQDLVDYLSGQASSPLPGVSDEAGQLLAVAEDACAHDKPERAIGSFRKALDLEPDNPTLLMSYATLCLQLNRNQETEAISRRVLSLEPGEMLKATACATLIEVLRSEGRYQEGNRIGAQMLDEGTSNFTKTIAYYEMAYNLAEMEEDLDRALEYARQSLELSPEELKQFPLAAVGWVHYKRSEFDEAVDFLSKASQLGPSSKTLTHLGMALLATGEQEEARSILAQAQKLGRTGTSLEQKMMECMKDSHRMSERVRQGQKR